MIGFAMCGSFCTISKGLAVMKKLKEKGYEIEPIMSEAVWNTDTRFGKAEELKEKVASICERKIIHTIADAEPIGPRSYLDLLIVAPCTGNTLAKLANGITDTSVTMAIKAQLRANKPVLISLASNDALSSNLQNIASLKSRKHIFFSKASMDDPEGKPHSLVAEFSDIEDLIPQILSLYKLKRDITKTAISPKVDI